MFEMGPAVTCIPPMQAMHDNNNLLRSQSNAGHRPFHSSPVRSKPQLKHDPKTALRIPQSLRLSYDHQSSDNPNVVVNDSDDVIHVNTEALHDDMGHPTLTTYHTNFLGLQFDADEALPFTSISNLFPPIPLDDLELELCDDPVLVGSCGRRRLECLDVEEDDDDDGLGGDGYGWQYRNNGTSHFVARGHIEEVNSHLGNEAADPEVEPKSRLHRTSTMGKGPKTQSIAPPSSLGLGLAFNHELPSSCTPPPRPKMRATSLPSLSFINAPKSGGMEDRPPKPPSTTSEAILDDSELVTTNLALLDLARDDLESLSISLSSLGSSSMNLESHAILCQHIKEATNALVDALSQRWKSIRQSGAWHFRSVSWQRKHVGRMLSLQTTLRRLIAIRDHPAPLTKKLKVLNRKLTEHNSKLRNLVHKIHASFDRLEMKCTHAMLVQAHADAKELRRQRQLRPTRDTASVSPGRTEDEEYRIRWQEEKARREELKRRLWNWKNTTLKRS